MTNLERLELVRLSKNIQAQIILNCNQAGIFTGVAYESAVDLFNKLNHETTVLVKAMLNSSTNVQGLGLIWEV